MSSINLISRRKVLSRAWPLILTNSSVPLLGVADTAVLGNFGSVYDLGAIALGALVFSFVYWGFGFLRMGTTGFVAQAAGAGDETEVRAALFCALLIAASLGVILIVLQRPIDSLVFSLLQGSEDVETAASTNAKRLGCFGWVLSRVLVDVIKQVWHRRIMVVVYCVCLCQGNHSALLLQRLASLHRAPVGTAGKKPGITCVTV